MKCIFCATLLVLFSLGLKAQNHTFYDEGAIWGQYYISYFPMINTIQNTSMRHVSNDTIYGKVYARLERIGNSYGAYDRLMYRDSAGYVYRGLLDSTSGIPNSIKDEFLMYNFNLQVNDTFTLYQYQMTSAKFIVVDVSMVNLPDGSTRKMISLIDEQLVFNPDTVRWVEGIGDIYAGHMAYIANVDSEWALLCYSSANGIAISNNYWYWSCDSNLLSGGYHPETMYADIRTQGPDCGQSNGYIVMGAYGGNGPFTFWMNGMTYNNGDTVFGLPAGVVNITIQGQTRTLQEQRNLSGIADSDHQIDSITLGEPTCLNYNGSITIHSSGAYQYSIYSGQNPSVSNHFTNLRAGTYTVQVTDSAGCIDRQTVFLGQYAYPFVDSLSVVAPLCDTGDGSIAVFTGKPGSNLTYSIDSGQTYQASNVFNNVAPGNYQILIRDTAGCVGPVKNVIVMVTDTLNTQVSLNTNTLEAQALGANYQWLNCDSSQAPVANETGQSFTPTITGNYAVAITDINSGCVDTSACTLVMVVGLNDVGLLNNVSLYPNPTNGKVTIDMGQTLSGLVTITNTLGQIVAKASFAQTAHLNLDLDLGAGVYFVTLKTPQGQAVRRLIVE